MSNVETELTKGQKDLLEEARKLAEELTLYCMNKGVPVDVFCIASSILSTSISDCLSESTEEIKQHLH